LLSRIKEASAERPLEEEPPLLVSRVVKKVVNRVVPLLAEQHVEPKKERYTDTKSQRPKHHVYGIKAALTIEMDELRAKPDNGGGGQTVTLEAAVATSPRVYDWSHKIAFQIMRREIPLLACALLGMLDKPLELGNHGQEANKFVEIEDQGERLFVRVKQGTRLIAVPVGPADVHAWLELVMRAMALNAPGVGDGVQLAALGRVASMHNMREVKPKRIAD
jgi:hypothetical protein